MRPFLWFIVAASRSSSVPLVQFLFLALLALG